MCDCACHRDFFLLYCVMALVGHRTTNPRSSVCARYIHQREYLICWSGIILLSNKLGAIEAELSAIEAELSAIEAELSATEASETLTACTHYKDKALIGRLWNKSDFVMHQLRAPCFSNKWSQPYTHTWNN